MIKLFRIASSEYITDISGNGARIHGGRWNHVGYPVVYTSSTRSLAILEFLVHVPMPLAPENLSIAEINIREKIERKRIKADQLPSNWRDYPPPERLATIGANWIKSKSSLLLDVPSAIIDKEVNTLINPLHRDVNFVNLASIEKFYFDPRFFKQFE